MRLDALSQVTYEYWKDNAVEHVRRKLSQYEAMDRVRMAEAMKADVIELIRSSVTEDVKHIRSDYDESYIRNLLSCAASAINYKDVADRICYDYIPQKLGITVPRFQPVVRTPIIKGIKRR